MKKSEKYIYIILAVILVGILFAGTTYILIKSKDNKTEIKENNNKPNNNEEPTKKDGVKLLKTYNLNDKIIEEFEITLNGKTKIMNVNFIIPDKEVEDPTIEGTFNDIYFYGKAFSKEEVKENFNISFIKNIFNENNFEFIKGTDNKSYLLVIGTSYWNEKELYVLNDDFVDISKNIRDTADAEVSGYTGFNITYFNNHVNKIEDNSRWYKNTFKIKIEDFMEEVKGNIHIKVEDNKIYFLNPIFEYVNASNLGYLEERVYTINNNKLSYKVINKYQITEISNQIS